MVQKIHLIFKTHLDVGFTDYAAVVLDHYFKNYIPAAIRVARQCANQTGLNALFGQRVLF